jgi:hypothetical protein
MKEHGRSFKRRSKCLLGAGVLNASQPCWLEVRPLSSGKFEPGNFKYILDYLYNCGKPFRFITVDSPSAAVEGIRRVRFFIQLPDGEVAGRLANTLRANVEAEVIEGASPPTEQYARRVELELKNHFALPICNLKGKEQVNPIDGIVTALSGKAAAIEVLAVEHPRAKREILGYIARKTKRSASFAEALLDAGMGFFDAFFGGRPPRREGGGEGLNPVGKAKVEAASDKANRNLLLCEVNIYGDVEACEAVEGALPFSPMNKLKRRRVLSGIQAPAQQLPKPKSFTRENALSRLWLAPLTLIPASTWLLGLFDPLRLANVDIFTIGLTAALTLALHIIFPRRNPLVLCTEELSLVVGMPTAVGQLPVETGTARVTRRQFAFGQILTFAEEAQPMEAKQVKPQEETVAKPAIEKITREACVGRPVRVEGVLRDPQTGAQLANVEFEVYEDGKHVAAYMTDGQGRFSFVFQPDAEGTYRFEIKPKGYAEPVQAFEVSAKEVKQERAKPAEAQ